MKEQQQTLKKELGIMDVAINVVNITIGGAFFITRTYCSHLGLCPHRPKQS